MLASSLHFGGAGPLVVSHDLVEHVDLILIENLVHLGLLSRLVKCLVTIHRRDRVYG